MCATGSEPKKEGYVWTAYRFPLQADYWHKNKVPNRLSWVADNVYEPSKPGKKYSPVLLLGNKTPVMIDENSPHGSKMELVNIDIDDGVITDSISPPIMMEGNALISTPKDREMLKVSVTAEFMILLPMSEIDLVTRATLIGWKPSPSSVDRLELLIVRDEEGNTKLELVTQSEHAAETVVEVVFEQPELVLDNTIDIHFTKERVEVYINSEKRYEGFIPSFKQGDGYLWFFDKYRDYQSFNIVRPSVVRIERS